jgi:serine/threonine protein kinase
VPGVLDIPGYSLVKKLGQGGMGVVYEATRRDTGERVAIKTIVPAPGTADRSIQLFRREMKLLAQLEHPRIVRFIDSGEHAGQLFLVMDYVECVDLKAAVSPLTPKRRIDVYCGIICQVLEALEYAHQRKLVHRDVKPGNILVSRSGRRLYAKLADFGLAKNFEMAGLSQLTADNELRGTPAFMPWEQLRNSRYAKPAVDIYSIAATLYFYLTGHAPGHTAPQRGPLLGITSIFRGAGRSATDSPAAASACDFSSIPEGLAIVLGKALSSEPKQRYATASAMREAIMAYSLSKR